MQASTCECVRQPPDRLPGYKYQAADCLHSSLCAGDNRAETTYVQHSLREHLFTCLTNREMTTFPRRSRKKTDMSPQWLVSYNVYCTCRLPEAGRIVRCDMCQEWFHSGCCRVPKNVWKIRVPPGSVRTVELSVPSVYP